MNATETTHSDWPERSWGLAVAGAITGFLIFWLTDFRSTDPAPQLVAVAAALLTFGIATAFTLERGRARSSAGYATVTALVVGLAVWWNGGPPFAGDWLGLRIVSSCAAVSLATPLFLAWRDAGSPWPFRPSSLSYPQVHDRAWTSAVLMIACWIFAGISLLLVVLLGELFHLIGIDEVRQAVTKQGFIFALGGGAFGAAAGVMRDRERILATLQIVLRKVLSVLGPVLGVGLLAFLLALPITGLTPLWKATSSTTPLLLAMIVFALTLGNAAIGDSTDDEARSPILRWGTVLLGVTMLPMAVIAAVSTAKRVGQHGLSPDRIWAIILVAIACAYGIAYLFALVRGRRNWWTGLRRANMRLAFGLCVLAFLLSTPLANFGAWSTQSQLARLESGTVPVDRFDWAALRFDFGPTGEAAVERLAKSGTTKAIREAAAGAMKMESWERNSVREANARGDMLESLDARLRVLPIDRPLPEALKRKLADYDGCGPAVLCVVYYSGGNEAVAIHGTGNSYNEVEVEQFLFKDEHWQRRAWIPPADESGPDNRERISRQNKALDSGRIEIRTIPMRKVYIDGLPAGLAFE